MAPYCQSSLTSAILSHTGLDSFVAGGEDFQSHIAAGFGPFVVLLGQHRTDQADDGVAARRHRGGEREWDDWSSST
jgi:hypothetical protein